MVASQYDKPDKYEDWVGIKNVNRTWVQCLECGFYRQLRNYPLEDLETIYKEGYRNKHFRSMPIDECFKILTSIKNSENERRYLWFARNARFDQARRVLDVGSGIGVWPWILNRAEYDVACVEENIHSIEFINSLGIPCTSEIQGDGFDTITLVHVLEHIEGPDKFLKMLRGRLRPGGYLFVEVPDAIEFEYLPLNHDEFNSCHCSFFDISSLYRLLERNGFQVTDMHREHYEGRNLSRIMCLAVNKQRSEN